MIPLPLWRVQVGSEERLGLRNKKGRIASYRRDVRCQVRKECWRASEPKSTLKMDALKTPGASLTTVIASLLWPPLPSLDTCVRFSALKVWISPSVFTNRSPSTKQIRACMVLFLWLQTSHKFWNSSTVNFHILHRTLWPSDSALHHLVRPLVKIQGLGLWHNIFSWSVPSWHGLGLAYWNGRFHPAQSHGHPLTLKQIRSSIPWITFLESMWVKIDSSASLRIHASHKAHIHSNCFLKTKTVKTEAIKVCESSTQTSSLQACMTPCSFPDALPSQIRRLLTSFWGKDYLIPQAVKNNM